MREPAQTSRKREQLPRRRLARGVLEVRSVRSFSSSVPRTFLRRGLKDRFAASKTGLRPQRPVCGLKDRFAVSKTVNISEAAQHFARGVLEMRNWKCLRSCAASNLFSQPRSNLWLERPEVAMALGSPGGIPTRVVHISCQYQHISCQYQHISCQYQHISCQYPDIRC